MFLKIYLKTMHHRKNSNRRQGIEFWLKNTTSKGIGVIRRKYDLLSVSNGGRGGSEI